MGSLLQEFTQVIKALHQNDVDYAICGGWAMTIHGAPRATVDIDFLIVAESLEKVFEAVKLCDYWLEGKPLSFKDGQIEIRRVSKVDAETGVVFTLDFLLVTPTLEKIWAEREQVEWENGKLWVVSREGLIRLKEISGRAQDLADIEKLKEFKDEG